MLTIYHVLVQIQFQGGPRDSLELNKWIPLQGYKHLGINFISPSAIPCIRSHASFGLAYTIFCFFFVNAFWSLNVLQCYSRQAWCRLIKFKISWFLAQDEVYGCLGKDVVGNAFDGYNACIFAYGQTGKFKSVELQFYS